MEKGGVNMKNFSKPDAGMVWTLVGAAATLIGLIASNKKEADNMDKIAEKAAEIVEKKHSTN